jgi:aspartyl-tRNA(Asn)/glutamyl-tRNA(Gln) amidotransferase subunit C
MNKIKLTRQEIERLAKMSRIRIAPHETEKLAEQIGDVLVYASSLQKIAQTVNGVVATDKKKNVMRADAVQTFDAELLLAQAPEREGNYFVVPKIIKQD